eukprot:3257364-Prymnesium_polylepis.1
MAAGRARFLGGRPHSALRIPPCGCPMSGAARSTLSTLRSIVARCCFAARCCPCADEVDDDRPLTGVRARACAVCFGGAGGAVQRFSARHRTYKYFFVKGHRDVD